VPLDAVLAAAEPLAREAAEELAGSNEVGEHLGVEMEGERLASHRFTCLNPGYRGWHWAVTVARVARARSATVCEAVLLPGGDSLLSPEWLPWSERLSPGDLGVGDLHPTAPDDERLEPGYAATGKTDDDTDPIDDDADRVAIWELGLGRPRVLSPYGREAAADRWYAGDHGPQAPIAQAAPASCSTCGFVTPLGGSLRRVFGVCTNEISPDDGRVVSYDHGCGAHSEVTVPAGPPVDVTEPFVDELGYDVLPLQPPID
jgi:hypothetical protein